MQFMVIERFRAGDARPVYRRFAAEGRLMPDGIDYVASWVSADLASCFQVMRADNAALLQQWVAAWGDLVDFEIVPVVAGAEASQALAGRGGAGLPPTRRSAP
jgi:hypothetical protein